MEKKHKILILKKGYDQFSYDDNEEIKKYIYKTNLDIEYQPLYKINRDNNIQMWKIGYTPESNVVYTNYGVVDGKLQRSEHNPESKGNKTLLQQAAQYINNEYEKQIRKGYVVNLNSDDKSDEKKQPMLAGKFYFSKEVLANSKTEKGREQYKYYDGEIKPSEIEFPVMISAKLDGMRILVKRRGEKIFYKSRTNIEMKNLNVFDDQFSLLFKYIPEDIYLDGEMYSLDSEGNHLDFQSIISILKKEKNISESDKKQLYDTM